YEQESVVANQLRGKIGNGGYVASDVKGETVPGANSVKQKESRDTEERNADIRYHKVAAGETLYSIAKRRKVTVDELCRLNHLTRDIKVRPGQLLRYS
ncbi:MAG: LysM peptidoglycan-binding domain-containing protein, partial [Prevotellaceae bacterium]|nr:LysM peptidoglycan-binding domain-containing protein [Prevotellaceae bacterium]